MKELDRFRHRSLSLEPPNESSDNKLDRYTMELEEEEVAYVFGRMGACKDKLARVSGTYMELSGSALNISGDKEGIERAKKYVKILLAQRHGLVNVDMDAHKDDLTLVLVPSNCKGFITGRRGATLRDIERECATLMTFCKDESNNREPLAIFGTRRGRLQAQLKVMSILEGKEEGWFVKDKEHPEVHLCDRDSEDGDWGVTWMELDNEMLGYALGKGGETRLKLQIASGCIIQYIGDWAAFGGRKADQERGKTYVSWLLDQRKKDFEVDLSGRDDVTCIWVPEPSVSYVTGRKANTLRKLESNSGTFCFFDKRSSQEQGGKSKEKMLIFSYRKKYRESAVKEVKAIVNFHQDKIQRYERVVEGSWHGSRSHTGSRSHSRSRSRSRSKSNSKSGSRSMSRD